MEILERDKRYRRIMLHLFPPVNNRVPSVIITHTELHELPCAHQGNMMIHLVLQQRIAGLEREPVGIRHIIAQLLIGRATRFCRITKLQLHLTYFRTQ